MSASNTTVKNPSEELMDDISDKTEEASSVDQDKLAALKAKMNKKNEETIVTVQEQPQAKKRSLRFFIVGTGQGGSRLAESFAKRNYPAIAINTASQDLENIDLPESNKLLLDYSLGGASKELSIGEAAAEANRKPISDLIFKKFGDSQVAILATSLGGGSGAGSVPVLVDILSQLDVPILVLACLPMSSEDSQTKMNSLVTLSKLADLTKNKKIAGLIVVDNAKIETIYNDVSQMDFYNVANEAIIDPLDAFNTFSSQPSSVKSLDPMEFSKTLIDGGALITYGQMKVANFEEDVALASAVIDNLSNNLLSSGFNLKDSKYVGVIIAANSNVLKRIPASSINYCMAMVNDLCGSPQGVFKGIYADESLENAVYVYSMFSGMGLPQNRIEQLKAETKELANNSKQKEQERNLNLKVDLGGNETVNEAEKIKEKIRAKTSSFGKLTQAAIIDRRNK